jgi:hypothetical protein
MIPKEDLIAYQTKLRAIEDQQDQEKRAQEEARLKQQQQQQQQQHVLKEAERGKRGGNMKVGEGYGYTVKPSGCFGITVVSKQFETQGLLVEIRLQNNGLVGEATTMLGVIGQYCVHLEVLVSECLSG